MLNKENKTENLTMFRKVLLFRNLIDNIPKNIGLYSVGVMLLLLFRFTIDLLQLLTGLLAFLLSYSSIYILNDIFDTEEDRTDEKKIQRKPIALGVVNRREALAICISFLILGLLLSILLNFVFFCVAGSLVAINIFYSLQLTTIRNQNMDDASPRRLKHTTFGLSLILLMQSLKIFLPWTFSTHIVQFPVLFVIGFSIIYVILFKGYKEYLTIGESVIQAPLYLGFASAFFISSMGIYPEPLGQSLIVIYILAGIVFFWNFHITDRRILLLSPIYILLGIIILLFMIFNI
jgi:4-hydroxybenzoate polyprenyltransferase